MATVMGTTYYMGQSWVTVALSLTPLKRDDAYEIAFGPLKDGSTHRYAFSVTGWQMGHDDVRIPAAFFAEAPALLTQKRASLTGYRRAFTDYLDGYQLVLEDCSSRRFPKRVWLVIYAPVADTPESAGRHLFAMFSMRTDSDLLVEFGRALIAEIDEAYPQVDYDAVDDDDDDVDGTSGE